MLREERLDKIVDAVDQHEFVTIDELVDILNVSKATVRRDINDLSENGSINKTRGGIMSVNRTAAIEPSLRMRSFSNIEEKIRIAKAAMKQIEYGDRVILDSGTTVLELAKILDDNKNLTVVTYDLLISMEIAKRSNIELLLIGGKLRKNYYSLYGYFAEQMMQNIKVNKAFISVDAIDLQQGLMSYTMDDIMLKKQIIECANEVILLSDHSKFKLQAFIEIAPLSKVTKVITGHEIDEASAKKLGELGLEVELV